MAVVERKGEWYTVAVRGVHIAQFVEAADANLYVISLLNAGLVDGAQINCGLYITA